MERACVILCLFGGLISLLLLIKKEKQDTHKALLKNKIVIYYPKIGFWVGIACGFMSIIVMTGFTIFSKELPHIIFYITFCMFFFGGLYLVLKVNNYKVIVEGEIITECSIIKKMYSYNFQQITSVVRQTKTTGAERVVIKIGKKRIVVENSAFGYKTFVELIKARIECDKLEGF